MEQITYIAICLVVMFLGLILMGEFSFKTFTERSFWIGILKKGDIWQKIGVMFWLGGVICTVLLLFVTLQQTK